MHAPDGTVIRGPERRQSPRTVGKPARMCRNKEKVLAAWKEKKAAVNKGTEKKEQQEMHRGSHGSCKTGGYGGRGGAKQHSLHLSKALEGENDNAKVPKVQEISDSATDDDDNWDDLGRGNGDGSNSLRIDSLKLK